MTLDKTQFRMQLRWGTHDLDEYEEKIRLHAVEKAREDRTREIEEILRREIAKLTEWDPYCSGVLRGVVDHVFTPPTEG